MTEILCLQGFVFTLIPLFVVITMAKPRFNLPLIESLLTRQNLRKFACDFIWQNVGHKVCVLRLYNARFILHCLSNEQICLLTPLLDTALVTSVRAFFNDYISQKTKSLKNYLLTIPFRKIPIMLIGFLPNFHILFFKTFSVKSFYHVHLLIDNIDWV